MTTANIQSIRHKVLHERYMAHYKRKYPHDRLKTFGWVVDGKFKVRSMSALVAWRLKGFSR